MVCLHTRELPPRLRRCQKVVDQCVAASAEGPEVIVFFNAEPVIGDVVEVVLLELPRLPTAQTYDCAAGRQEAGFFFRPLVPSSVPSG